METGQKTVTQESFEDVSEQGQNIYASRLKAKLEPLYPRQFVAIHVESGDYAIAKTTALATRELLKRHSPNGRVFLRKIGDEPVYGLAARLLESEMRAGRAK